MTLSFCACGCGERVKDKRSKYLRNHHNRNRPLIVGLDYEVVDTGYKTPCHLWLKCLSELGYARLSRGGETALIGHVYVWTQANGPVPEGLELDHLCSVRRCIREDHLEPITHAENVRRSNALRWARWREAQAA